MKVAATKRLRFPEFTNKRRIDGTIFYINQYKKQKCKVIFGLDFLIENEFDFLLSSGMIEWQDIQIPISGNIFTRKENDCVSIGKQIQNEKYRRHTGNSVTQHKNAAHF